MLKGGREYLAIYITTPNSVTEFIINPGILRIYVINV